MVYSNGMDHSDDCEKYEVKQGLQNITKYRKIVADNYKV